MIKIKSFDEKEEHLYKVIGLKNKVVLLWSDELKTIKQYSVTSKEGIEYSEFNNKQAYEVINLIISPKTKSGIQEIIVTNEIKEYLRENFKL